jgi:hypothetical protein
VWLAVVVEASSSVPPLATTLMLVLLRMKAPSIWVVPLDRVRLPPADVGAMVRSPRTRMVCEPEGAMLRVQAPLMVSVLTSTLVSMTMFTPAVSITTSSPVPGRTFPLQLLAVFQVVPVPLLPPSQVRVTAWALRAPSRTSTGNAPATSTRRHRDSQEKK